MSVIIIIYHTSRFFYRLFVTVGAAVYLYVRPSCPTSIIIPSVLSISIIGFLVLQLAAVFVDVMIMAVSNLGSLHNCAPRQNVVVLVYIGSAIFFGLTCWDIFNTFTVFSSGISNEQLANCTSYTLALTTYRAIVLSYWGMLLFLFGMYAILMDPFNCCVGSARLRHLEDDIITLKTMRDKVRVQSDSYYHIHPKQGAHSSNMSFSVYLRELIGRHCNRRKPGQITTPRKQAISDFTAIFKVIFEDFDYTFLDLSAGFKLASIYHEKLREQNKDPTDLIKKVQ